MAAFGMIVILLLLCLASAALARLTDTEAALLPLPVLGGTGVVLLLFGFAGALRVGGWLVLAALAGVAVLGAVRFGRGLAQALTSPGFVFFAGASLFVVLLFWQLRPMFIQWDEFTFWGTACKMVKAQNMLFPAAPGNLAARTYLPGMMLLSYFFQLFGAAFSEWQCLAAYDILFFAAMAACASLPKKQWAANVCLAGGAFLLPFFFTTLQPGEASIIYRNAMGDLPLAILFGGALCVYFAAGRSKKALLLAAPVLCLLTITKDMGFAYALIAVGVIFLDLCATLKKPGFKGFLRCIPPAAALAVPVVALFVGWSRYCAAVIAVDRNSVGSAGVTYGGILTGGISQFFGVGRTELFATLMDLMGRAFFSVRVCLLGSGAVAVTVILAVAVLAFATAQSAPARRRVMAVTLGLGAAFAVFYLFHLFLYYYNFAQVEALALKDYSRYIGPYYQGWLLTELCLLGRSVAGGRFPRASRAGVLAVCGALAVVFCWRGLAVSSFWSNSDSLYELRRDVAADAAAMNPALNWTDRVLILSQGDDSTRWYYYNYELNATVQYGFGGYAGDLEDQHERWDSTFMNLVETFNWQFYDYEAVCTPIGLVQYLREKGCDYLLIDRTDDYLVREFGERFEGGLALHQPATLYKVVDGGGENMTFTIAAEADE